MGAPTPYVETLFYGNLFFIVSKVGMPPTNTEERAFGYKISNQHSKTVHSIQKKDYFREKCQNRKKSESRQKIRIIWQRCVCRQYA